MQSNTEFLKGFNKLYGTSPKVVKFTPAVKVEYYSLRKGMHHLRFLPALHGSEFFYTKYEKHAKLPKSNYFTCPSTIGKPCELCDAIKEENLDKKYSRFTKMRVNVIDMDNPSKGVQVCDIAYTVFKSIYELGTDPDVSDFTDPVTGRTVNIEITDNTHDTYCTVEAPSTLSEISEETGIDVLGKAVNLKELTERQVEGGIRSIPKHIRSIRELLN